MKKTIQMVFIVLSIISFLWFLSPLFVFGIMNIGNLLGMAISVFVFINVFFVDKIKTIREKAYKKLSLKSLWIICRVFIILFFSYAIIISGVMIGFSLCPAENNATAIVLGAKVNNSKPTLSLSGRISSAYEYLLANPNSTAILSGGKGADEDISEAQCMYNELTSMGIAKKRLIMEDKSTNTYENIENSYSIIMKNKLNKSLAIVTDNYHQLRARLIGQKQGIRTSFGAINAHSNLLLLPTYFVREWVAIPYEFLLKG